jgi:predicted CoA-substrate-specific enzyme activase
LGIVSARAVVVRDEDILAQESLPYSALPRQAAEEVMGRALRKAELSSDQIDYCHGTGYGRRAVPFADDYRHDMGCLHRAARKINPEIRTVIDVGGHTLQAFSIDDSGRISENVSLSRCVTGTGLFLEVIARALGMSVEEITEAALASEEALTVTSQCVVLAESEVISLVNEGKDRKDIFAGFARFVAHRIGSITRKVIVRKDVAFVGGVAKNRIIKAHLEESLDVEFDRLSGIDPQVVSAYGAALTARDTYVSLRAEALPKP